MESGSSSSLIFVNNNLAMLIRIMNDVFEYLSTSALQFSRLFYWHEQKLTGESKNLGVDRLGTINR